MKSLRPLFATWILLLAVAAVIGSMTCCDPEPPEEPTVMESLLGDFTGNCYHTYKKVVPGQPEVMEQDTMQNSPFKVSRLDADHITINGCGTDLLGTIYLPETTSVDTAFVLTYYIGDHIQYLKIDFPNRKVDAYHRVNGFGGNVFDLYEGVWTF